MPQLDRVLYTASTHTSGGRDGWARSSDGRLDIRLSSPGGPGTGTNPEQLFAAGWSACFMGAIQIAASRQKVSVPPDIAVDAEIDLGTSAGAFALAARLAVSLPDMDRDVATRLLKAAGEICPYSRALHGNIDVDIYLAGTR